ncbi:MAG: hypothetical protein RLY16_1401 [Bacteroidota bacterium]
MKRAFIIALQEEVGAISQINGDPILYCGVGKINATIGAMQLVQDGYTHIINLGSCGSRQLKVGDIVQVGKAWQDIDCTPICAYGHTAFEADSESIVLNSQSPYTCFSTDYFYELDHQDKYSPHYLQRIESSSVFDMELFGIAKVCKRFNVQLTAFKWISDDGNFSDWQQNCEAAFHKILPLLEDQKQLTNTYKL